MSPLVPLWGNLDPSALAAFVAASLALLITPGPAVLYVVARSIDQGRLAGLVATLGISAGTLVHVGAAAFGVSAILVTSALAFSVMKYLGAAYLVYLGVHKLLEREPAEALEIGRSESHGRLFRQGIVVSVLNPKNALFFFAFLPQFVDIEHGLVTPQVLFLGCLFIALSLVTDGSWAFLAGTARNWLRDNIKLLKAQRVFAASVLIGLGIATALSGSERQR